MKKKKNLSKYKQDLWKVFALYIKKKNSKDGEYCECYTCGASLKIGTSNCQAGHFYSKKGFPGLYFVEDNVWPQCYHCNISLSGNTQIYEENLIIRIGQDRVNQLHANRHSQVKRTISDYIELIEHYKKLLNELL